MCSQGTGGGQNPLAQRPSLASRGFITMETELPSSLPPAGCGAHIVDAIVRSEVPSSFLLQPCHRHHRCPSTAAHT